ncbi:MAG: hypothetical protein HFE34_00145 [Clostridia bacterium]|jgi:hypothetical protein|nr:hypothetical protein [Clostridia bacterium]
MKAPDLHKRGNKIGAIIGEQKKQREFRYNTAIGCTEYTVLIREEETAINTFLEKLKKLILRDSLEGCYSKGEEAI